jgi:hypothetical protein
MDKKTKEILNEINQQFSYLKENSIFDDEEMCSSEECIENMDVPEEEDEQDDKISSIRSIAFKGLQEFENNVQAPEYDFFKKIWMMCDKMTLGNTAEKPEQVN